MGKAGATILLMLAMCVLRAQRPVHGNWLTLNLPVRFSERIQWHNDAGYRTLGESFSAHQFFYRTGFRCRFNRTINAAAGAAFFFTRASYEKANREFGTEFRLWQEVNAEQKILKKFVWSSRMRTEQRFFEKTNVKDAYTAGRLRFRILLRREITDKLFLQVSEEYMSKVMQAKTAFDQNRIVVSASYQLKHSLQLQPGYMWLKWPESQQRIWMLAVQKNISVK